MLQNKYCDVVSRFESGTHPREPVIDLLTLTQLHTASLEDHAKHLTKYDLQLILFEHNYDNNRFIISTIGPATRHSFLMTKGFLRLLSASYALCSVTFHVAFHNFLPPDIYLLFQTC